jgi:hypothetical protein
MSVEIAQAYPLFPVCAVVSCWSTARFYVESIPLEDKVRPPSALVEHLLYGDATRFNGSVFFRKLLAVANLEKLLLELLDFGRRELKKVSAGHC